MARATVLPGRVGDLRKALEEIGGEAGGLVGAPLAQLPGVHFARLFLIADDVDPGGNPLPATLVYTSEVDAPVDDRLRELASGAGDLLDATFGLCEGYPASPAPEGRAAFLRDQELLAPASYVNTIGRTVEQIQDEARLHDAIEAYLDRLRANGDLPGKPADVRTAIQDFVRGDPQLAWALKRAPKPSRRWRARELAHAVAVSAALLLLTPLILVGLLFYLPVLRLRELRDPAPHLLPDRDHVRRLSAADDHAAHNAFTALGFVKHGKLRLGTVKAVLALIDFGARHIFKRADLAGVKTIHFAHWIPVDGYRRVIFTSYYDGSLESYMDDFIDKVAFGLNASFSNGVGYPKTRFLLWQGAKREEEFKAYLRRHQLLTPVWYSAYPNLTARNIENNALIRSGLAGTLAPREAGAWLRRL